MCMQSIWPKRGHIDSLRRLHHLCSACGCLPGCHAWRFARNHCDFLRSRFSPFDTMRWAPVYFRRRECLASVLPCTHADMQACGEGSPPHPLFSASWRGRLVLVEATRHKFRTQIGSATVSSASVQEEICSGYGLCPDHDGVARRAGAPLSHTLSLDWSAAPAELGGHLRYMRDAPTPEHLFSVSGGHFFHIFLKWPLLYFWALFLKFSEMGEFRGLRAPRPP